MLAAAASVASGEYSAFAAVAEAVVVDAYAVVAAGSAAVDGPPAAFAVVGADVVVVVAIAAAAVDFEPAAVGSEVVAADSEDPDLDCVDSEGLVVAAAVTAAALPKMSTRTFPHTAKRKAKRKN